MAKQRKLKINTFLFIGLGALLTLCNKQQKNSVEIDFSRLDTCFALIDGQDNKILAARELEIVENSLTDSIAIGFGVLPPNYLGKIFYSQEGNVMLYRGDKNSRTDSLCFNYYNGRRSRGKIKIEYLLV